MGEIPESHLKILIGIPVYQPDDRFLESLPKFVNDCEKDYAIQVLKVANRSLVEAQNYIATHFMENSDCDYLLLMENDHWGFTKEMLDNLVEANKEIIGMNYYSRHFPYVNCLMRELPGRTTGERFAGLNYESGIHKVFLTPFGMTLIKRSLFDKLDKPYFRLNKNEPIGSYATDVDFCERLNELGVDIYGCFDYVLPHRDITKENRLEKFLTGIDEHRAKSIEYKLLNRRKKCTELQELKH